MWWVNFKALFELYSYQKIGFSYAASVFWTLGEKLSLLLALLGLDFVYEGYVRYFSGARKLHSEERRLAATIFKGSLDYDRVRINENRIFGTRKGKIVYASIRSVNSYYPLDRRTLIHELVHIWQYQKFGVSYIVRSLAAQLSPGAYAYGKEAFFRDWLLGRAEMKELNYEQQASAVEEFYSQLYLNQKILSLGSGELWEIDRKMFDFIVNS